MNINRPLLGIGLMMASMAVMSVKDGIAKSLVANFSPAQMIWAQYAFTFAVLAVLTAPKYGTRAFRPSPFGIQAARGLSAVGGVSLFYWALSYISLPATAAMSMIAPLVVTAFSPFILNEKIGIRRVSAVVVGFAGVLVILKPGSGEDTIGYLIAFVAGVLFGFNFLGNRLVAGRHPPLVSIAHNVLIGMIVLSPVMPFIWRQPGADLIGWTAGFLVLSLVGHGLMVVSFAYGPATVIAPYQYTTIIFATIVGYLAFGDLPDLLTWLGIAMIIGAGLYIAVRERELQRKTPGRDRN